MPHSFTPEHLERPVPVALTWLHGSVMECRGRQALQEHQRPEVLETLRQTAIIQSAESSNRIEGVVVDADRLAPLVTGSATPRDRPEEEVVGYREALSLIHEHHGDYDVSAETLRTLHRVSQAGMVGDAGEWKTRPNDIVELFPDGRREVRFRTMAPKAVPEAVEQLCRGYDHTLNQGAVPPVLAAASLVLDLTCIHPFRDGNGRVSRLATLLVLYHHDFRVGRYISVERIIEQTKESYYEALRRSSVGWHEGSHDLVPWWTYFLSTVRQAYREFEDRVQRVASGPGAKSAMVRAAVERMPASFTAARVHAECPTVSSDLVRKVLRELRDDGLLVSGVGRGARWTKVR